MRTFSYNKPNFVITERFMAIHTVYIIFMIFRLIECKSSSDIKYKIQIQMEENILEIDRGGALITFYVQTNNIFCINHCLFCQ